MTLLIRPRFPLFGGWKTQYTLGYNLPSYEVLSHDGSHFSLNIRFVVCTIPPWYSSTHACWQDHIYDDMVIDAAEVRVILPEGASNIQVKTPFATERAADGVCMCVCVSVSLCSVLERSTMHVRADEPRSASRTLTLLVAPWLPCARATWSSSTCRLGCVRGEERCRPHAAQEFELTYEFSQATLLREPLMLVAFFAILLLSAIVINRVDMTIVADKAAKVKQQ